MFSDFEIYLWGVFFSYVYIVINIEINEHQINKFSGFFVLVVVLILSAFSWIGLIGVIMYQMYRRFKK